MFATQHFGYDSAVGIADRFAVFQNPRDEFVWAQAVVGVGVGRAEHRVDLKNVDETISVLVKDVEEVVGSPCKFVRFRRGNLNFSP